MVWPKSALAAALDFFGVPAAINTVAEVFADSQVVARGMQIEREQLPGVAGPIVIDGERMVAKRASPSRRNGSKATTAAEHAVG